jgi:hypothetical protein
VSISPTITLSVPLTPLGLVELQELDELEE